MGRLVQRGRSRSLPPQREFQMGFGAGHTVPSTRAVRDFLAKVDDVLGAVMPERPRDGSPKTNIPYKIYGDEEDLRLSILEGRLPARHSWRYRQRCTPNDVGRLQVELDNEVARLRPPDGGLWLVLSGVKRVGNKDPRKANKLALVCEPDGEVPQFLCREHDVVAGGVKRVFNGFDANEHYGRRNGTGTNGHSDEGFTPHLTFAWLDRRLVTEGQIADGIAQIEGLLPVRFRLEELDLVPTPQITKRSG